MRAHFPEQRLVIEPRICCDCGLPSFSISFFDSCSEVQTRNFSSPLDNNGSHNSSITDCMDAQASPSLGSPVQASSPSRKISNKGTGNIARKTSRIQDTLTQELREPSSSNDSDNDQSSLSTSLPHTCNSNQLRVILRVCIVNFCSLVSFNKHLELYQLIDTHKPDIIIGTETHLNKDIDSREIFPPNYVYSPPVRKDQDSGEKRGGVVIAVNSNIISVEQSSCSISHKSGSVVVGSFYRPPSTSVDYLEQLELSMNNIKKLSGIDGKYVLLGGDFNLPDIDWEEGSVKSNPQYTAAIN